jgi:RNA recognition motif-containing protein
MLEWPENDYRIYCCNLGNEVNEDILSSAFKKYPSFAMCKVIKDRKTEKSKGFGFISIIEVDDYK